MKQLGVLLLNPGQDASPFHCYSPPPFTPLAFYQVSLTNFCYPFILLGGDRHCKSKVFCTRTQHIDWNPDLLTLSPAQARLGYKCRPLDRESTSLIIRPPCLCKRGEFMLNPFSYETNFTTPKKNSLIWFLNWDYWLKLIKDVCL